MPIQRCTLPSGGQGWQWGQSGKCYADKADAIKQMVAIEHHGGAEKMVKLERELAALAKTYASPGSATSGLASYALEGQRKSRRRRRAGRKMRGLEASLAVLAHAAGGDLEKASIDSGANDAATSPYNSKRKPSEKQLSAGNYSKGHITVGGIQIAIENPAGTVRRPGWPVLSSHYGYIKRTEGADGDQVDAFIRVGTPEDYKADVHIVDQIHPMKQTWDEHKVMIGWDSLNEARAAYLRNFTPGWKGLGAISTVSMPDFKRWLREGDTTKPYTAQRVPIRRDGAQEEPNALTPATIGGFL